MSKFPKPSNGSLICTFADCPNREENIYDEPAVGGDYEQFCHLGARRKDFSRCKHANATLGLHPIWNTLFCEVACREGVCPRGFIR